MVKELGYLALTLINLALVCGGLYAIVWVIVTASP